MVVDIAMISLDSNIQTIETKNKNMSKYHTLIRHIFKESALTVPATSARFYFRHKYGRQPVEGQCLYKFTIFPEN